MNYKKYKNWYSLTRYKLIKKYKSDYKLIAGLLASTSPQYNISRNMRVTLEIYNSYIENKQGFLNDAIADKNYFMFAYDIMNCHYNNVISTLKHDITGNKKLLVLSGQKVDSFYNNLIGNYNRVTIDTWMLRYFKHTKNWVNKTDYKYYSKAITKYAKKMKMNPAQAQAVIWIKIRHLQGYKPVNFASII